MLGGVVANRYAAALFSLAQDTSQIDTFESELHTLVRALRETPEFKSYLSHPKVAVEDKKASVTAVFASVISEPILNFVKLLLDKGREEYLPSIFDQFVELVDQKTGRVRAHIESAIVLTEEQLDAIAEELRGKCGKIVVLSTSVNSELIGGVKIRFGDQVIDGSIKGLLNGFRESLARHQVS